MSVLEPLHLMSKLSIRKRLLYITRPISTFRHPKVSELWTGPAFLPELMCYIIFNFVCVYVCVCRCVCFFFHQNLSVDQLQGCFSLPFLDGWKPMTSKSVSWIYSVVFFCWSIFRFSEFLYSPTVKKIAGRKHQVNISRCGWNSTHFPIHSLIRGMTAFLRALLILPVSCWSSPVSVIVLICNSRSELQSESRANVFYVTG